MKEAKIEVTVDVSMNDFLTSEIVEVIPLEVSVQFFRVATLCPGEPVEDHVVVGANFPKLDRTVCDAIATYFQLTSKNSEYALSLMAAKEKRQL